MSGSITLDEVVKNQTPKQHFENRVVIVIIDDILSALARLEAYYQMTGVFGILRQLGPLTADEILKRTPTIAVC